MEDDKQPAVVITVYRTHKINKYWKTPWKLFTILKLIYYASCLMIIRLNKVMNIEKESFLIMINRVNLLAWKYLMPPNKLTNLMPWKWNIPLPIFHVPKHSKLRSRRVGRGTAPALFISKRSTAQRDCTCPFHKEWWVERSSTKLRYRSTHPTFNPCYACWNLDFICRVVSRF